MVAFSFVWLLLMNLIDFVQPSMFLLFVSFSALFSVVHVAEMIYFFYKFIQIKFSFRIFLFKWIKQKMKINNNHKQKRHTIEYMYVQKKKLREKKTSSIHLWSITCIENIDIDNINKNWTKEKKQFYKNESINGGGRRKLE